MSTKRVSNKAYQRAANLRQRLLRASRAVNVAIVKGLHARGFEGLRSTHTALLSNLDLGGASLTAVARRAGMTKQAMGRLADELIRLKYIETSRSEADRREVNLAFTKTGLDLMQHSFAIMDAIEKRCVHRMGKDKFQTLLSALSETAMECEDE